MNDREYVLQPVAEKAGFAVFECGTDQDGAVPKYPVRRKIESQVAKLAFEHQIVFVDSYRRVQVWQWVKREAGRPAPCREQHLLAGQGGDPPPTPPSDCLYPGRRSRTHHHYRGFQSKQGPGC